MRRLISAWIALLAIQAAPAAAQLDVWALGDSEKLFQHATYEASNTFWNGATRTVSLHGARNEVIAFQIALRSAQPVANVTLAPAGDFTGVGGSIDADHLDFYLEYYADIEIDDPGTYPGDFGFDELWPDALIPFRDPYESDIGDLAAPFDVEPNVTEVVWVDLYIPDNVAAGAYTATVDVRVDDLVVGTLTLSLDVWDFELPKENHLWHYGLITSYWGNGEGESLRDLPDSWPILKNYLIDGRKHRLAWDDTYWPTPTFDVDGNLTDMDWTEFDAYEGQRLDGTLFADGPMAGSRYELARVTWPAGGSYPPGAPDIWWSPGENPEGNPVYENNVRTYIEEYVRHFVAKGWDMPLFMYGWDESGDADYHIWWADLIDEANENLITEGIIDEHRVMYMRTRCCTPEDPDNLRLIGHVDLWATRANGFDIEFHQERQAAGDKAIFYHWSEPYVGHHTINTYGFAMRTKPLIAWKYDIDGIYAEWSATSWKYIDQIYNGAANDHYSSRWGNGVLYYPGHRLSQAGYDVDIFGPVPSIRLKALRRGYQDYEYAYLLESLGGDPDALIDEVMVNAMSDAPCGDCLGDWSHDPDDWYQLRRDLADAIATCTAVEAAAIEVDDMARSYELAPGGMLVDSLLIRNIGNVDLVWQASDEEVDQPIDASWLTIREPISGTDAPYESSRIVFEVDATDLMPAEYDANILIETNAPRQPRLTIPVSLTVGQPGAGATLSQNHPNPFGPGTSISFNLARTETVSMEVYDSQGRLIRRLVNGEVMGPGPQEISWDGRDGEGVDMASGVYLCKLRSGATVISGKMMLVR